MIVAGMHGTSARNLAVNTLANVTGINAGILLFPSSVTESELETAFESDYSSFVRDHCVGFINCTTSVVGFDEFTDIKFNSTEYECSGVNFSVVDLEFLAEDASKSMIEVAGTTFYYPKIFKYEDLGYVGGSSSDAYTVGQLNAIPSDYTYTFDLETASTINRLMSVESTSPKFTLIQGWYSSGNNRVYKDLVYYGFDSDITVDTLITRFSLSGTSAASSSAAIQLFAKVEGSWILVFTSNYEFLTRDTPLVRTFNAVTAREWRIGLYGHAAASLGESTYLNINTFMLGNSSAVDPETTLVVDKAVIIPAAALAKFSDAQVEACSNIPAIIASAGPDNTVGLFSQTLAVGKRIPFIEASLRIGV